MKEIKCPNCGEVFAIDEQNYASIAQQIRNHEFAEEVAKQTAIIKEQGALELKHLNERLISEKKLLTLEYQKRLDQEMAKHAQADKQTSDNYEQQVKTLREQIAQLKSELTIQKSQAEHDRDEALKGADIRIATLEQQLKNKDMERDLAVNQAIATIKDERDVEVAALNRKYDQLFLQAQAKSESYEQKLLDKDLIIQQKQEQVDFYKDLKTKMSTKMIGETLEQHCALEFNRNRSLGMFKNAYFEKDNDVRTGSKGDFIYRDYDETGMELISIMFEMKNEADTTVTKHRNEDFFKELDKDRREKGCEYAVLVSLLESDNELYNGGIVDVSYRYPKMYVVRPQFFIAIITLLRNAAFKAAEWKRKYEMERNNNLDITHFEENIENFKSAFGKNYELASRKFADAIEDIDKTIKLLERTKTDLMSSDRNLRLANDKAQNLTVKKLTKNAPSVAEKFLDLAKKAEE